MPATYVDNGHPRSLQDPLSIDAVDDQELADYDPPWPVWKPWFKVGRGGVVRVDRPIGAFGCWCGDYYGHSYPLSDQGAPHPVVAPLSRRPGAWESNA